jgi:MFS family permease
MQTTPAGAPALGIAGKAAILFSTLLTVYAVIGLLPVLPAIMAHFADTPGVATLVRLLMTSVGFTMIFGAPAAGLVAERFGVRRVLVVALCVYAIVGTLGGLIDNLWLLLASRIVLGFAAAASGTLLVTLATTSFEGAQRDKWLGWVTTSGTLGSIVLLPASGFLGQIDWRMPFLLYLIALPLLVLVLFGVPNAAAAPPAVKPGGIGAGDRPGKFGFPYALAITGLFTGIVIGTSPSFLAFHLANIGVTDAATVSLALLPATISSSIVGGFFGVIRKRLSMSATFCVGFVLTGIGLAMIGIATGLEAVIVGQTIAGCGIGLLGPNLYGLAAITGQPEHRARNVGIAKGGYMGGPFFGQLSVEPIAQMTSAGGAIVALGLIGLIVGTVFTLIHHRQPTPLREPGRAGA